MKKDLLYTGIKTRIQDQDTTRRIKFIGKQNKQLEKLKEGHTLPFQLPAVLIGFRSPGEVQDVGGGVQVQDLVVEVEVLHQFINDTATGTAINLDVYEIEKYVHGWLQGYAVRGDDYGCSDLSRIEVEEDEDHDQVYSKKSAYATTWVDNSTTWPRGGIEMDGPVDAQITAERLESDEPEITASVASLSFGNVSLGGSSTLTFTIQGSNLNEEPVNGDPLIISTNNGLFLISFATNFKTRLAITPTEGEIDETTVNVKFTPTVSGGVTGSILYGVPGINGEITLSGAGIGYLLQENGDFLLQENGDKILL